MYEKIMLLTRLVLAVFMLAAATNEIFVYIDPPIEGAALEFWQALNRIGGGYIIKVLAIVQVLIAIAFIINRYVALAAIVLFPIMLNAFLFHIFLDLGGVAAAAICFFMNILILIDKLPAYEDILKP